MTGATLNSGLRFYKLATLPSGGNERRVKKNTENTRISYLLLVVRCVWQHGRNMEHDLIVFVCCVQRMGSSGVSYSKKKKERERERDNCKNRKKQLI